MLSQTSIKTIKIKPRVKVINDNVLIPRLRPRRTDIIAIEVIIQMIPVCVFSLTATEPSIRARIELIWAQPKPKDVHTPKVVQEMDKASITSPAKPFV